MKQIEFKKNLDEMNDAELRATLREFRTEYSEAQEDYEDLENKVDDLQEFQEKYEEVEEKVETLEDLHPKFAELASEVKELDTEILEEKFSTDELYDILDDADVFSLPVSENEDGEDEEETEFAEKEQKSKKTNKDESEFSDRIDEFFERNRMLKTY